MNKAEELKLKFVRKWTSLLNEAEVVQDLDEYAQLYADKQSREVATQFCAWFESVSHRHKGRTWLEIYDEWKSKEGE